MEVVSGTGIGGADQEQTLCLITVTEVTILPPDNVDLLTLNPALTSCGIYLTQRKEGEKKQEKNIQLCNMDSLGYKTRDGS